MTSKTEMYKSYLEQEGYRPTQEGGLLLFKHAGWSYIIVVHEDDPEFFELVCPRVWSIDSDEERTRAYWAANIASAETKGAKMFVSERHVWVSMEMLFDVPEQFKGVFHKALRILSVGVAQFARQMHVRRAGVAAVGGSSRLLLHVPPMRIAGQGTLQPQPQETHDKRQDPAFAEAEAAPGPIEGGHPAEAATPIRSDQSVASLDHDPATRGHIARNAQCPCRSGKRYKHCHGRTA